MDDKGYIVPPNVDPHEMICFRVYVPKDTLYIGAFWRVYEFFTSWLAWARDPMHRGKRAAAVWRVAYSKARAEFEQSKGVCEMNITGVRQNPLNPCELQYEVDGNNQWIAFADLSKCATGAGGSQVMRFNGTTIQIYDDCAGDWSSPNPTSDPMQDVPPTAENIYTTDGRCLGAANIADYVERINLKIVAGMAGVEGVLTAILEAYTLITAAFPITAWLAILSQGFAEADQTVGLVWSDQQDPDFVDLVTGILRQTIYHNLQDDGTLNQSGFNALIADLQKLEADAVLARDIVTWGDIKDICQVLGYSGLTRVNKVSGITDPDCTELGWRETFDFVTGGQSGWTGQGGLSARFTDRGFEDVLNSQIAGNLYRGIRIDRLIESSTITRMRAELTIVLGENTSPDPLYSNWHYNVFDVGHSLYQIETAAGEFVVDWIGSQAGVTNIIFAIDVGHDDDVPLIDPAGSAILKKIVIEGTGVNPFI